MGSMMQVTHITENDIEDICNMAELMHEENASHLPFERDIVARKARFVLDNPRDICCLIAHNEAGVATGFLVGNINYYFFNSYVFAQQELVHVKREFRGSSAFARLITKYEEWLKERGAIQAIIGVVRNTPEEYKPIAETFSKLDYHPAGYYFKKEIKQ